MLLKDRIFQRNSEMFKECNILHSYGFLCTVLSAITDLHVDIDGADSF